VTRELDVDAGDGRTLHAYDTGGGGGDGGGDRGDDGTERLAVMWHHGTPNVGAPPAPLFGAANDLGLRWVSFDRPGYGGSTASPDRDVDALGIGRFAVVGHSGGGPHALACAALLADRVVAAVSIAGLAPYPAEGIGWFAGMTAGGIDALNAALAGREEKERYEHSDPPLDLGFTPADIEVLSGEWSWFAQVVVPAIAAGPAALIDDDLAFVHPWGFDVEAITAPVLFVHGEDDLVVPSSHSKWLAGRSPNAALWLRPGDGHLSVLRHAPAALEWIASTAGA